MQKIYRKIFEIACTELPHKHYIFGGEECVMYRGFKISLKEGVFYWEDTRDNNYYEPVDPLITNNILISGFLKTLTLVGVSTNVSFPESKNRTCILTLCLSIMLYTCPERMLCKSLGVASLCSNGSLSIIF